MEAGSSQVTRQREFRIVMDGERTSLLGRYLESNERFTFFMSKLSDIAKVMDGIRELLLAIDADEKVRTVHIMYPKSEHAAVANTLANVYPEAKMEFMDKEGMSVRFYGVHFKFYPYSGDSWLVAGLPISIKTTLG